jgi:hypothetical protein
MVLRHFGAALASGIIEPAAVLDLCRVTQHMQQTLTFVEAP